MIPESVTSPLRGQSGERKLTFSKVFRWRMPPGHTKAPATVEVAGSFNHWQKVPLHRDSEMDSWHATIHHIQGNRTHHYMLFVDGQAVHDKNCDGLAVPVGAQEESFAIKTDRGMRLMMLFAQTK